MSNINVNKKVLVSGVQSSGIIHIGNYFGAIKQNIDLSNSGEFLQSFIFIADYHSMTSVFDSKQRQEYIIDAACVYLACGLDPSKTIFFKQSDVLEHTELSWILSTITPISMLELAHSYKDKINNSIPVNVGLFTYPVLMASDILIYDGEIVPVGKDQEQHLEMAREIAGKFNRLYGDTFKMPQAYILPEVGIVPGIDGKKMSKSKNNYISIFGKDEEIKKSIMSIVTDSAMPQDKKDPDTNNIYNIHKLFIDKAQNEILRQKYLAGGLSYKDAKQMCFEDMIKYIDPMRSKYNYYKNNIEEVIKILNAGSLQAKEYAKIKVNIVKKATGLDA